jgi:putative ABC transport system permease protein
MSAFREAVAITALNLRNVPSRLGMSLVIVVGIAGVVGVLISLLAMAGGLASTVANTGRPDRAIVLHSGSISELASALSREDVLAILDAPGIRRGPAGKPVASAEAVTVIEMTKTSDGTPANVTLRGVGAGNAALRPEARIVAGRMLQPALRELVVGKAAQSQFRGLALGSRIKLRGADWTVVGVFETGDAQESEIWGDAETLLSAYGRSIFQDVTVQLEGPGAFDRFKAALTANPRLAVDVQREPEYYEAQTRIFADTMFYIGYLVGAIMTVGAIFAALNTMYSAVSARTVEIATLRAIGFGAGAVVSSVFAEALLLSLAGAVASAVLAWLVFNGHAVSISGAGHAQLIFPIAVTPGLVARSIVWGCVIGLLGGLAPAIRAARLPVATVLRAL